MKVTSPRSQNYSVAEEEPELISPHTQYTI